MRKESIVQGSDTTDDEQRTNARKQKIKKIQNNKRSNS
jgi:hypothetical protein